MAKAAKLITLLLVLVLPLLAQEDFKTRQMLKKTIFYVYGNGTVESCDYWSLALGKFDVTVQRDFPGEGILPVEGSVNLNFMCSGYIEGKGYGERGNMVVSADFAILKDNVLTPIKFDDIDYVFYSGTKVALKNESPQELFLQIETPDNKAQASGTSIKVFGMDKEMGELKCKKDVPQLIGFSFTKEGALRAYKAALAAN